MSRPSTNNRNANNLPQGSASLEGAEFTVRYYDGFYDTEQQAEASGAPTRTWVFRTNKNGTISLQYSDLVSGDPLYEMNGIRVFPRGTLVIRETKAPDGYKNVIPGSTYEVHGILMDAETGLPLLSGEGADKVGEDELTDFWHELCDLTGITSAKPLDEDFDLFAAIGGLFGQTDEDGDGDEVWFPQVEPDWEGIAALLEDNPEIAEHLSTATETFEADKDHGEIEMDFGLDASDLAGKKAVVFELLVKDGIAVGAHSDLADEDQTVTIVPSTIGTEATDKTDGDHEVMRLTDEAVASPIVTLCTCSYNRWADNERTVVYAAPIGAEKSASENPQVDGAL